MSSPARRLVTVEATRGLLLYGGVACLLIAAALGGIAKPDALLWADRTTLSPLLCAFTAPVLGAVTAMATASRMGGLAQVAAASPRGRWFPARAVLLAALGWAGVVTAAQVVVPLLVHGPTGGATSWAVFLPWLQVLAILSAIAGLGVLAGLAWQEWPVGPVFALAVFLWCYGSTYLPGRAARWASLDNGTFYQPWLEPAPRILLGHTGMALALFAATVALVLLQASPRRTIAWLAAGALAVASVGLVATSPLERSRPVPLAIPAPCRAAADVRLCVWPGNEAALEPVTQALVSARASVDGRWSVPTAFAQAKLPSQVPGTRVEIVLPATSDTAVMTAISAVMPRCSDDAHREVEGALTSWLAARLGQDPSPDSDYSKLARRSEQDQTAWVRSRLTAGDCR